MNKLKHLSNLHYELHFIKGMCHPKTRNQIIESHPFFLLCEQRIHIAVPSRVINGSNITFRKQECVQMDENQNSISIPHSGYKNDWLQNLATIIPYKSN
jgi:hypothetical protein